MHIHVVYNHATIESVFVLDLCQTCPALPASVEIVLVCNDYKVLCTLHVIDLILLLLINAVSLNDKNSPHWLFIVRTQFW